METLALTGGRVLRPDLSVRETDVVVDREAGEVVAVGDETTAAVADLETAVDDADRTLDAGGGLVMPGLVNAHTHVAMTLFRGYADDKELDAWLREDIWPAEAELTPEDVRAGADLGLLEFVKSGTTAFADMYFHEEAVVDAVVEAGLRARVGHGAVTVTKDGPAAAAEAEETVAVARDLDGRGDGRVRAAVMPHSLTTVGEEHLETMVDGAREAGLPVHYHANESADEVDPIADEHGKRPLSYAADRGALAAGDFLAHGVHLEESEIELLAARGAAVVHCPASNMKLASGIAPVEALREAGVTVALGTDGAGSNNDLDLFDEMRDAAMVGKLRAGRADAVSAEAVVKMATRGGAEALGFDGGRIAPGADADLAVVDLDAAHLTPVHDVVSHLAYAVRGSDVRHTVCDGEVLMRDREVLTMDEAAVRERASEAAAEVVARAEDGG
ncbi:MAG: amidohydrolase [Halolamina sp.]